MNPVARVEKQVEVALDDLVVTGTLQTKNRMDLDSLVNPACESQQLDRDIRPRKFTRLVIDAIAWEI